MTAANPVAKSKEFTGWHMWAIFIAFFGVVIAVNVTMAVISAKSWAGFVVENSYVASQQFEDLRIAHEKQLAAGWKTSFLYAAGTVRLVVTDAAGKPVDIGTVTLQINRPVGGHDDQKITLARAADGSYSAAVTVPSGLWEAWANSDITPLGPFELHERFSVETGQ